MWKRNRKNQDSKKRSITCNILNARKSWDILWDLMLFGKLSFQFSLKSFFFFFHDFLNFWNKIKINLKREKKYLISFSFFPKSNFKFFLTVKCQVHFQFFFLLSPSMSIWYQLIILWNQSNFTTDCLVFTYSNAVGPKERCSTYRFWRFLPEYT